MFKLTTWMTCAHYVLCVQINRENKNKSISQKIRDSERVIKNKIRNKKLKLKNKYEWHSFKNEAGKNFPLLLIIRDIFPPLLKEIRSYIYIYTEREKCIFTVV